MVCIRCLELYKILKNNNIQIQELNNPPIKIYGFDMSENKCCEECNKIFQTYDLYLETNNDIENFELIVLKYFADLINKEIEYCSYCDGSIIEDIIRAANEGEDHELISSNAHGTTAYDLLCDYEIPMKYQNKIEKMLECKTCSKNGYKASFDLFGRIYGQDDMDKFFGENLSGEILRLGRKYGIEITTGEINEFVYGLNNAIMLAYSSDTGRKIYSIIENLYKDNVFTIVDNKKSLFRGRKRGEKEKRFEKEELWAPPVEVATQGRFNLMGNSILYLSDNYNALPYELDLVKGECIDVGCFTITEQLKMLDTEELFDDFGYYLYGVNKQNEVVKKEYLLCNYIAQCCENIGYDGIIYPCVMVKKYKNYAVLNWLKYENIYVNDLVETVKFDVIYEKKEW